MQCGKYNGCGQNHSFMFPDSFPNSYYIFVIYFHVISICFRRLGNKAKCMVIEVFPFILSIESLFKSNVTSLIVMITVYVPVVTMRKQHFPSATSEYCPFSSACRGL